MDHLSEAVRERDANVATIQALMDDRNDMIQDIHRLIVLAEMEDVNWDSAIDLELQKLAEKYNHG